MVDEIAQFKAAVREGDSGKVRDLLSRHQSVRAAINEPLFNFDSPAIVVAASRGDLEMLKVLIEFGAQINARSQWWAGGWGVLHWQSLHQRDPEVINFLIAHGAVVDAYAASGLGWLDRLDEILQADPEQVNSPGPDGLTPLHFARNPQVAQFLLDRGAEIDARDIDHRGTPAQWSVSDRPAVCEFLLEKGSRPDALFLHIALGNRDEVQSLLSENPTLLSSRSEGEAPGGHINSYTGVGSYSTPLITAARFHQTEIAELLIDLGADPSERGEFGGNALHWAAWHGSHRIVRLLVAAGAPLNVKSIEHSATPLIWALDGCLEGEGVRGNYFETVSILVDAGADLSEVTDQWLTKLKQAGQQEILNLLKSRGR
ncbi:MAG: ankyrin repeat domain-containing protein [Armatimonadetes bacterium]|nr:ankyrin repeat domain-containing protein [Armatimonadota bacterium]MDW8120689.1 ankyrin repeat domain-containing protein [Armatimonadota bacterium]